MIPAKNLKILNIFNEWFATSIVHDGQRFLGVTAIELSSGTFYTIKAKALIIATGGAGRLYSFSTYALTHQHLMELDMAFRAGMALKDMEFVQFHPTGIYAIWNFNYRRCTGRRRLLS